MAANPLFGGDLSSLLPPIPDDWELAVKDKIYTPETLYDYIDGGAELYLSYDMLEVASRIIRHGENEIRIEIFDMQEAKNAFGVFSHTRTRDEGKYGQGSQYFTGAQLFWKGRYFVALTANDENEPILCTLDILAGEIDRLITQTGELPEIIQTLPEKGLVRDEFVYFHHYIWLNSYYFISSENLLNINAETDAVLAKYGDNKNRYFLLLIQYPDAETCHISFENMINELFEGEEGTVELESGRWMTAGFNGKLLVTIFNAPGRIAAEDLLKTCIENTKEHTP